MEIKIVWVQNTKCHLEQKRDVFFVFCQHFLRSFRLCTTISRNQKKKKHSETPWVLIYKFIMKIRVPTHVCPHQVEGNHYCFGFYDGVFSLTWSTKLYQIAFYDAVVRNQHEDFTNFSMRISFNFYVTSCFLQIYRTKSIYSSKFNMMKSFTFKLDPSYVLKIKWL